MKRRIEQSLVNAVRAYWAAVKESKGSAKVWICQGAIEMAVEALGKDAAYKAVKSSGLEVPVGVECGSNGFWNAMEVSK